MDTKSRIVDTAESLFAHQGFTLTSLRVITSQANVNLSAVNYHFGNKRNLVQAVFKRYFDVLMPLIDKSLAIEPRETSAESLFNRLISPLLALDDIRPRGCATFLLLLGHGYNETQGYLRGFIHKEYGDTLSNLIACAQQCMPRLSAETLFWRLHFALGATVFAMAASNALAEIAQADFDHNASTKEMLEELLPFVAHGTNAR